MKTPILPKCIHGKIINRFDSCPECISELKKIQKLINPLIDEYWESKGKNDLYHIIYYSYRMGMNHNENFKKG